MEKHVDGLAQQHLCIRRRAQRQRRFRRIGPEEFVRSYGFEKVDDDRETDAATEPQQSQQHPIIDFDPKGRAILSDATKELRRIE